MIGRVPGQRCRYRSILERAEERLLLHVEQARIEREQRRREGVALQQLTSPAPAPSPDLHRERRHRDSFHRARRGRGLRHHQIFSMLTRKALNSGVRELASPTNGVSALASQFAPFVGSRSAAIPTNPQWIGIPMWETFLPPTSSPPRRFVTMAPTSSSPRLGATRTRPPLSLPFSRAAHPSA